MHLFSFPVRPRLWVFLIFLLSQKLNASLQMSSAVFGDSFATGAATHQALKYDSSRLWQVFDGKVDLSASEDALLADLVPGPLAAPVRLLKTRREFSDGLSWLFSNLLQSFSHLYLDTEEYGWGYLSSRALNYQADHILIAAEDGAKSSAMSIQAERVLSFLDGSLPQLSLVLFTGNDLCASHPSYITPAKEYAEQIKNGLQYLIRNGVAGKKESHIFVAGFLGVGQILSSESILSKSLLAHGEKTTCKELRSRLYRPKSGQNATPANVEQALLQHLVPPNPANMCPTLFAQRELARQNLGLFSGFNQEQREKELDKKVDDMVSLIANSVRAYRRETKEMVDQVNFWSRKQFPEKQVMVHYVEETEFLEFSGDDIAEDCFHINLKGQKKVASSIVQAVKKLQLSKSS